MAAGAAALQKKGPVVARMSRAILISALRPTRPPLQLLVSPHQLEETQRVAHRVDAANFIGINCGNGNGGDAMPFPARDDEHFAFVFEPTGTAQNFRDDVTMEHAKSALRIGNLLPANTTNFVAHVTVYHPP